MKDIDSNVFVSLFKEACEKCFSHPLTTVLSETESKLLGNQLLEKTGLVIGPKSLKNYSAYVISPLDAKSENPSVATLDTLARYVLGAPYTDEVKRKDNESHYPYWFEYRDRFSRSVKKPEPNYKRVKTVSAYLIGVVIIVALIYFFASVDKRSSPFDENFSSVNEEVLTQHGWIVQSKDNSFWSRRNEKPGYLTLFTLKGDNWPDSSQAPGIKNLLLRKIDTDCFTTEVHFKKFIPQQNWQQAGLLLLEDTTFTGKSVRVSLAYNDFFGGFTRPKEILIQVITSNGKDRMPEEVAHAPLFLLGDEKENEKIFLNLDNSALRIEKQGNKLRFLASSGSLENTAFKEIVSKEIDIQPNYIGIFALKGFVDEAESAPVQIKFFKISGEPCAN